MYSLFCIKLLKYRNRELSRKITIYRLSAGFPSTFAQWLPISSTTLQCLFSRWHHRRDIYSNTRSLLCRIFPILFHKSTLLEFIFHFYPKMHCLWYCILLGKKNNTEQPPAIPFFPIWRNMPVHMRSSKYTFQFSNMRITLAMCGVIRILETCYKTSVTWEWFYQVKPKSIQPSTVFLTVATASCPEE